MYCKKHLSTKAYLGKSTAEQCGHDTSWKYQKYCGICSQKLDCCQECGMQVSRDMPPPKTEA